MQVNNDLDDGFTIPNVDADYWGWHQGRRWAGVWVFEVDDEPARKLMRFARRCLADWLLPRYLRQPHISLGYIGLFADANLPGYDRSALASDLGWLRAHLPGTMTFHATRWNSFALVACLDVEANGNWLNAAHCALSGKEKIPNYQPHITVGQYSVRVARKEVIARLNQVAIDYHWTANKLTLVRYVTTDLSGPLMAEGWLDLRTGGWTWAPEAVLKPNDYSG